MGVDDAAELRARAASCCEQGDLQGALCAYLRLLSLKPDDPEVLNDLGALSFQLGRLQESVRYFAGALRLDPQHREARQNLTMLCQATGAKVDAVLAEAADAGQGSTAAVSTDLSVVVPVHDGFDVFDRCLDALHGQTLPAERCEVLVVANGVDGDARRELISIVERWQRHFGERLRLVEVEQASIALARNEGIRYASGRIVLQINADAVLSRTALAEHYAEHERMGFDPRCVVIGGREFPPLYLTSLFNYLHESIPLYTALHQKRPRFLAASNWFVTCNLSCLKEAYERFGVYDPSFAWGSDQELGMRWEKRDVRMYVNTNIVGYHLHWLSFDSWRGKCITGTPHWFRRHMGMTPEELPASGRQAVRDTLDECEFNMHDVEREIRRVEESFNGPESFSGESIMGVRVRTLAELNSCLRRLLKDYRTQLQYAEIWKRIESAAEAPAQPAFGREAV
ncbi:MAG: glycosyltransferase [Planctomycetota bacterium]|jgi:GT2 family glycosyltransferase